MIRFIVGPGDELVPDVSGRLPGRGMWVTASRDALETATGRKQFARSAKMPVKIPAGLADQVENLLKVRCLDFLGMARRAGDLVMGLFKVEQAIEAPKGRPAAALILASDAKNEGRRKTAKLSGGLPVIDLFSGPELDLALGKVNVVHAALIDGGLARIILDETARLSGFHSETEDTLR